jgi:thiol-disulfide isomerase/thioredoxin
VFDPGPVQSGFIILLCVALCGCFGGASGDVNVERGRVSFYIDDSTTVMLQTGAFCEGKDLVIHNGKEDILLTFIDEGVYAVPVFGGSITGKWMGGRFGGVWTDSLRLSDYQVAVEFEPVQHRAEKCASRAENIVWETSMGLLVASVFCDSVHATVLTPTGDYRYLSGSLRNDRLELATFDGAHLFHFSATVSGDSLVSGLFKSGAHYVEKWNGVVVSGETSSASSTQPYNKEYPIEFQATSLEGQGVSYSQTQLLKSGRKLLVVDVLGSWCPNCLDEVRLMKELSFEYPEVEFVSVSFERGGLKESLNRLADFKEEMGVDWRVLYGGRASKSVADSVLPFMGGVRSFPTTVFIPSEGPPVVHTGFNGPATGPLYVKEEAFFRHTIEEMLK